MDYIQLHGDEDVDFALRLKSNGLKIIKVFRVADQLPSDLKNYDGVADLFLFDTATKDYGGSGRHFNWEILKEYSLDVPYLLSGGIRLEDLSSIKELKLNSLVGIDVNSQFETEHGLKDLELVNELKLSL